MGWLHSRPKSHDKDDSNKSRYESLAEGDPLLDLPECDEFIVTCWHELGLCLSGGYGSTPLTFTEIKAYSDSACELSNSDVSVIAKMSRLYCSEQSAATNDINRPAPHEGSANIDIMRQNVAKSLKAMFKK